MTFLRFMVFSLALFVGFTLISHSLPQVQPDMSEPVAISTEGLDMDGMVALGETIFKGKGTCTLCHNDLGRAPNLLQMDLAASFGERLSDARYKGVAAGGEGPEAVEKYIRESMQKPSAFVVSGFGKKGSNDTVSPMPVVDAAPIELSPVEINAVIAFLQDRAGMTPTVPLPSADETPVAKEPAPEGMVEGPATDAQAAIDQYGCAACHDLFGSGGEVGPALGGIAGRMSRVQIMQAIIDPNDTIAKGFEADIMPQDFGDTMFVSELELITDHIMTLPVPNPAASDGTDEGPATTAQGVIENYGCAGCHDLEDSGADVGPALKGVGNRMSRDQIKTAIIDPNATIAEGFEPDLMPGSFGDDMTDGELQLLLDYLTKLPE